MPSLVRGKALSCVVQQAAGSFWCSVGFLLIGIVLLGPGVPCLSFCDVDLEFNV